MITPDENKTDNQDERSARAEEDTGAGKKNAVKHGAWQQRMVHDEPQDEQMNDEFGKGGEPVPPGEGKE